MAEKKEESSLLIAVTVIGFYILNKVIYIVASVDELTGYRLSFALVHNISVYVADIGDTCHNTCAVAVAKSSLDMIFFIERRFDNGIIRKSPA